ncbi:MAG: polysaccharide export protein [Hyphomicrobiales bacterium]|nr:polysaccharide export protein [Hyphomicrobiales bacterium]
MGPCRLLAMLLIALAVAGCAGVPGAPIASAPPDAAAPGADLDNLAYGRPMRAPPPEVVVPVAAPPPLPAAVLPGPAPGEDVPYTLDSGDRLRVVVFGQDGLSNTYIVDVGGRIALPLVGAVPARALTTTQLARAIADRLRNGGFVREPHVAIEIESYRPFFILGEVIAPGQYPYVPNMTVETAVAIAGGYSPRAYRYDAEISRSSGGVTARQKVPPIAPVRPGDTVTISERWF